MSSFFTVHGAQKKRKRPAVKDAPQKRQARSTPHRDGPAKKSAPPLPSRREAERDNSISGSDSDASSDNQDLPDGNDSSGASDASDGEVETAAERRLRLAERYLENVRQEVEDDEAFDAEDIDRDLIAARLQEDVAETKGKVYRHLAAELAFDQATHTIFRWNTETVTSVATCAPFAYTATKDMFLTKWRIQDLPADQWPQTTRKKPKRAPAPPKKRPDRVAWARGDSRKARDKTYRGHTAAILAVAASQDGRYVVTGGADRRIVVWDAETLKPQRVFSHHRDAVTGLAFRRGTAQLYSSSRDRTIKVWDVETGAYVQTLFGHQEAAEDVSALAQERCVSVGGDRTARLWRVVEETQLVFRGGGGGGSEKKGKHKQKQLQLQQRGGGAAVNGEIDPYYLAHEGSMDRVSLISDDLFVTGSDNGSLALWTISRKKPLFVWPLAHGIEPALKLEQASAEAHPDPKVIPPRQPRWITALRAIPYSDVFLSGSWDGYVRVWKLSEDKRRIERVGILGLPDGNGAEANVNGVNGIHQTTSKEQADDEEGPGFVKGVVNEISTFERGDRGKDGLCVVVAIGKQHRLGRWIKRQGGRNGAMVFEVPRVPKRQVNGVHHDSESDREGV